MKCIAMKATLLAAITGLSASAAGAADYRQNPFTLVYEGAITKNQPGKVNIQPVTYKLNGLNISANVYTPANYDRQTKYSAIVVAHPNGGVKEQVAGLYAQRLAEKGYITIAADAAYQGASGGSRATWTNPHTASRTSTAWRTSSPAIPASMSRVWACSASAAAVATRWPRRTPTNDSRRLRR